MPKVLSKKENKISIIGDNILYNNGVVTAFYIMPVENYKTMSKNGALSHIDSMTNMFTTLSTQRPGTKFSLCTLTKIITREDVYNNLLDTIHIYRPGADVPDIFKENIKDNNMEYCILAIDIDVNTVADIESASIKGMLSDAVGNLANQFFSLKQANVDIKKVLDIENNIYSIVSNYCSRCSRDLTFYRYISAMYPSYEISYNDNSFLKDDNLTPALGAIKQCIESKFGYFVMYNEGIDLFDLPPQETYGCILKIVSFPESIDSSNFNIMIPGLQINIETIPKDKAKLAIKRMRASIQFEKESAMVADAEDTSTLDDNLGLAEFALQRIQDGQSIVNFDAQILVLGNTYEELKQKKQRIITMLADIGVLCSISFNQAEDFLNGYVKLKPSKYPHMADMRYPLSFQIDTGTIIGDSDDPKFAAPAIGTDEF